VSASFIYGVCVSCGAGSAGASSVTGVSVGAPETSCVGDAVSVVVATELSVLVAILSVEVAILSVDVATLSVVVDVLVATESELVAVLEAVSLIMVNDAVFSDVLDDELSVLVAVDVEVESSTIVLVMAFEVRDIIRLMEIELSVINPWAIILSPT